MMLTKYRISSDLSSRYFSVETSDGRKMGQSSNIGLHLKKRVTVEYISNTWKNGSQFEKWVTLEKSCHDSHLEK